MSQYFINNRIHQKGIGSKLCYQKKEKENPFLKLQKHKKDHMPYSGYAQHVSVDDH